MLTKLEKFYLYNGTEILDAATADQAKAQKNIQTDKPLKTGTISYGILAAHNTGKDMQSLRIRFDALTSHDITYVGIVQTARASGLKEFPMPYVLTNCHNSLCAVGGTLNEDDHMFGYSAARKYGGIYVPPHLAVIHSYAREELAGCGRMVLGSDSHTRYGALGTMAVGEGGPELAKQLLQHTYDIQYPDIIAVYLIGKPAPGVGPHDVAIALCKEVFEKGLVKNKVLEFVGPGIANLEVDFRNGIDVMTTETTCLSSIWMTDEKVKAYYETHKRPEAYKPLAPEALAEYDGCVYIDLSEIKPMIAMPFHPSNAYTIEEFQQNTADILALVEKETEKQFGKAGIRSNLREKITPKGFYVDQGVIAGCAGGIYDNIMAAADIMRGHSTGNGKFSLSVYPSSQSVALELLQKGAIATLMESGAIIKTAFCGPCFGAGDVPAHNAFSIRHTTRNFPNREGSKPNEGQISYVALMDARSIAATAANGGILTAATELAYEEKVYDYTYHREIYEKRVYNGYGDPHPEEELILGPNISDWPKMLELPKDLVIKLCSVIRDKVTTTDELIPSGETSTLRSNPYKLSQFTLSRKDPQYVPRTHGVAALEEDRKAAGQASGALLAKLGKLCGKKLEEAETVIGSGIYANMPGDGSAREQAASSQKVLGGWANIALEYATKRYRSNLINWGILPLLTDEKTAQLFAIDDFAVLPDIRETLAKGESDITAYLIQDEKVQKLQLKIAPMTDDERNILLSGGLINYYGKSL